jgi:thiamine-monophosphate kinase
LGDSLWGLHPAKSLKGKTPSPEVQFLLQKHLDPVPRLKEGKILADRKIATTMIDVSDGLLSDLKPFGEESRVGAVIWAERIPQSEAFRSPAPGGPGRAWKWALKGGEDYELLFSVPPEKASELQALAQEWPCGATRIERIEPLAHGVLVQDEKGTVDPAELKGYDHFA